MAQGPNLRATKTTTSPEVLLHLHFQMIPLTWTAIETTLEWQYHISVLLNGPHRSSSWYEQSDTQKIKWLSWCAVASSCARTESSVPWCSLWCCFHYVSCLPVEHSDCSDFGEVLFISPETVPSYCFPRSLSHPDTAPSFFETHTLVSFVRKNSSFFI